MNILVTGATGFLGSHLTRYLLNNNHSVVILKRSFSDLSRIANCIEAVKCYDIDRSDLASIMAQQTDIDAIIHCATNYGHQQQDLAALIEDNVLFGLSLLEQASQHHCRYFINCDSFYSNHHDDSQPLNHYSTTKKQFLGLAKSLCDSNSVTFINCCFEHIYGPQDNPNKAVPKLINACLANENSIALTPADNERDFIYVDDACRAILLVLKHLQTTSQPQTEFSIGSGTSTSIKSLATLIQQLTHSSCELDFSALAYHPGEIMFSQADTQALHDLGWQADVSLSEGLLKTIASMSEKIL